MDNNKDMEIKTEHTAGGGTEQHIVAKEKIADDKLTMQVKVYSPFKVYFEGEALSMSAESQTGPFDILPRHHNFITLLTPCTLTIRTSGGDENITISGGIMHVKTDDAVVFLDV